MTVFEMDKFIKQINSNIYTFIKSIKLIITRILFINHVNHRNTKLTDIISSIYKSSRYGKFLTYFSIQFKINIRLMCVFSC